MKIDIFENEEWNSYDIEEVKRFYKFTDREPKWHKRPDVYEDIKGIKVVYSSYYDKPEYYLRNNQTGVYSYVNAQ